MPPSVKRTLVDDIETSSMDARVAAMEVYNSPAHSEQSLCINVADVLGENTTV